ncbi:putative RING/U-box superfamily protein [Quillaja saponaria]|uniref:RING/U-box superfamily protein n=1 Tax=Quillaja saponaria TaxID=32244 RepID=A0AAD7L4Z6_QUISA|nr:putative RING/U-box superfamily protein [Quillaja saponaria]
MASDIYHNIIPLYNLDKEEDQPCFDPFTIVLEVTDVYGFDQAQNVTNKHIYSVPKEQILLEPRDNSVISNMLSTSNVPLGNQKFLVPKIFTEAQNQIAKAANKEDSKVLGLIVSIYVTRINNEEEAMVEDYEYHVFEDDECHLEEEEEEEAMDDDEYHPIPEEEAEAIEDDEYHPEEEAMDDDEYHPEEEAMDDNEDEYEDEIDFNLEPAPKASIEKLEKVKVEGSAGGCCMICLDDFVDGGEVIRMPCFHLYHGNCIVNWLQKNNLCPLCRSIL